MASTLTVRSLLAFKASFGGCAKAPRAVSVNLSFRELELVKMGRRSPMDAPIVEAYHEYAHVQYNRDTSPGQHWNSRFADKLPASTHSRDMLPFRVAAAATAASTSIKKR